VPEDFELGRGPAIVLGHGAGSDHLHPFMVALQTGIAAEGIAAITFNFPYREQGRNAPDRTPVLEAAFERVVETVRERLSPGALFLGGKSLGGRMASHLAAKGVECRGLVFFGYPLHPPNRPDKARTAHLPDIRCPMLFLAGTRDSLSDLSLLRGTLQGLRPRPTLHVIEGADHSFKVLKRSGRTHEEVVSELISVACAWMKSKL